MMLFLGAGASKQFGIPTMKEMSEEFENKANEFTDDEKELCQSIRNELGTNNLENILTVLNDLREESGNPSVEYLKSLINKAVGPIFSPFGVRKEIKKSMFIPKLDLLEKLWINLIYSIKENCVVREDKQKISKIYDNLFRIIGNYHSLPIDIFTTNYDLVIEEYFKTLSCRRHIRPFPPSLESWESFYYDGFREGIYYPEGYYETTEMNEVIVSDKNGEILFRNCIPLQYKHKMVPIFRLFKLHGSIDQYYQREEIVKKDTLFPTKTIEGVELKDSMIYPVREKELYKDPFFEALARLKTSLLSEKICVVIGYSFGDEHIQNIFFDAVKRNPKIRLILANPNAKKINDNLKPIKANIEPIGGEFGEESVFEDLEEKLKELEGV